MLRPEYIEEWRKDWLENTFYDYNKEEVGNRDATDFHAMNGECTEILGQFLDRLGCFDVEVLKEILVDGYIARVSRT